MINEGFLFRQTFKQPAWKRKDSCWRCATFAHDVKVMNAVFLPNVAHDETYELLLWRYVRLRLRGWILQNLPSRARYNVRRYQTTRRWPWCLWKPKPAARAKHSSKQTASHATIHLACSSLKIKRAWVLHGSGVSGHPIRTRPSSHYPFRPEGENVKKHSCTKQTRCR